MKFCSFCDNMLYMTINPDKDLLYYCKNCNCETVEKKENGSICVIEDNKIDDVTKYTQYLNKNIKYDPTLPRVNNIKCPICASRTEENTKDENGVVYLKYDFLNMKYIYYCCNCEEFFKSDGVLNKNERN